MSLINCPECGNECASSAVTCPNCGHPFIKPVAAPPRVVVQEIPREDSFPKWVFIPLALLGVVILFVLFTVLRKDDTADQRNINVNVATARQPERVTTSTVQSASQPSTVTIPSTSQPSTVTVPQTVEPPPTTVTSVPSGSSTTINVPPPVDKGSVAMEAKIMTKTAGAQPVSRVKFYLLDKDLDSILSEARIEDELGQGLVNAFGLSVVDPSKYRDVNSKAYAAIKRHIVYSTTTDGSGKAQLQDVKPKDYYLFGVTATKKGFAIWNAPIVINNGQNSLILDPVTLTEVVSNEQ